MPMAHATLVDNRLLQGLPRVDRRRLLDEAELVDLVFDARLCEAGAAYKAVYFPVSGLISLVNSVVGHPPLETGLIGREGMLGATLVLGVQGAPRSAVVQGAGRAWRIAAPALRRIMRESPALRRVLNHYVFVSLSQLAQSAACARFHEVEPRLARWMLLSHDRAEGDRIFLTHQHLAGVLGVRRSAITIAAGVLQQRGVIRYSRGTIEVIDRAGLEAAACGCYAAQEREYAERFG